MSLPATKDAKANNKIAATNNLNFEGHKRGRGLYVNSQPPTHLDRIGPNVISLRSVAASAGTSCEWHSHPFYEFALCAEDSAMVGHVNKMRLAPANTLFLWLPGESHCYQTSSHQSPRFWVLHFSCPGDLVRALPTAFHDNPLRRQWRLGTAQAESFRWAFLRLVSEQQLADALSVQSGRLRLELLLLDVERWANHESPAGALPPISDPELLNLWKVVNDCVGKPEEFARRIRSIPNYDSLRHGFKKSFGQSPTKMLYELTIHQAKHLLLETRLSIKEIAGCLGYERQHDFSRAFRRRAGLSPTEWRNDPRP